MIKKKVWINLLNIATPLWSWASRIAPPNVEWMSRTPLNIPFIGKLDRRPPSPWLPLPFLLKKISFFRHGFERGHVSSGVTLVALRHNFGNSRVSNWFNFQMHTRFWSWPCAKLCHTFNSPSSLTKASTGWSITFG